MGRQVMKIFNEPVWPLTIGGFLIVLGVPQGYVLWAILAWAAVCVALGLWQDRWNHRA